MKAAYIDFQDRNNKRIKIDDTKEEVFYDKYHYQIQCKNIYWFSR